MKQYIHITRVDREFLMKVFNCTERSIFNAVQFDEKRGFTEQAKKIRKLAIDRGGILMTVAPSIETLHDYDNVMRQYFPNGALLELDKNDGSGVVIFKGEQVKRYENVTLPQIESIQNYAAQLR